MQLCGSVIGGFFAKNHLNAPRRGAEPETSGADNLETFAVVEAACGSASTGEAVYL